MDRKLYKRYMKEILFNYPNLDICSASVFDLIVDCPPNERGTTSSSAVGSVSGVKLGKLHPLPGVDCCQFRLLF